MINNSNLENRICFLLLVPVESLVCVHNLADTKGQGGKVVKSRRNTILNFQF